MYVIQYHPNLAGSGQHCELAWEVCQGNHGGCARKFYDAKQFLQLVANPFILILLVTEASVRLFRERRH
jgi:hypothetical protein